MSQNTMEILVLIHDPIMGSRYETREIPCTTTDLFAQVTKQKKIRDTQINNTRFAKKR